MKNLLRTGDILEISLDDGFSTLVCIEAWRETDVLVEFIEKGGTHSSLSHDELVHRLLIRNLVWSQLDFVETEDVLPYGEEEVLYRTYHIGNGHRKKMGYTSTNFRCDNESYVGEEVYVGGFVALIRTRLEDQAQVACSSGILRLEDTRMTGRSELHVRYTPQKAITLTVRSSDFSKIDVADSVTVSNPIQADGVTQLVF